MRVEIVESDSDRSQVIEVRRLHFVGSFRVGVTMDAKVGPSPVIHEEIEEVRRRWGCGRRCVRRLAVGGGGQQEEVEDEVEEGSGLGPHSGESGESKVDKAGGES